MRQALLGIIFFFTSTLALAFDHLYCQSDLKDWIVIRSRETRAAILSQQNQNTSLTEQQSQRLIVLDPNMEPIATLFPWNSLFVRIHEETKKRFEVKSTEIPNGFLVQFTDKKTSLVRFISCRFTF